MSTTEKTSPPAKRGRPGLAAAVIVVLLAGAWLASSGLSGWFEEETGAIEGFRVERGNLSISVTERGNLTAKNSHSLKCEVEGRTTILYLIEEGTHVAVGDLIAELDVSGLLDRQVSQELRVQAARNSFTKAKANLEIQETENESLIAQARLAQDFAEQDLAKFIDGERDELVALADEEISLAEEDLKIAEDQFLWSEKLAEKGFLTRTELERDELSFARARIMMGQKRRAKELLIKFDLPKRLAELEGAQAEAVRDVRKVELQAEAQVIDFRTAVETSERMLELEEEELAKNSIQIEKAVIRAPVEGFVVYGREEGGRWGGGEPVKEGTEVRERKEIVSIPGDGQMVADASVHESVLEQVTEGLPCLLAIDALPGREFHGTVSRVARLPDKNSWFANPNLRLYKTEIVIEGSSKEMRPGMSCSIEILVDELTDVLKIPLQAVVHNGGRNLCFVRSGREVEEREVEVGQHNTKWVEVRSGLSEGELVLLTPPPGLLDDESSATDPGDDRSRPGPAGAGGARPSPPAATEGSGAGSRRGAGGESSRRGLGPPAGGTPHGSRPDGGGGAGRRGSAPSSAAAPSDRSAGEGS
ncbi:MAG: HlyD family efflux transporter periplasmic adaptor subunit [Planctomycetota bacterium]|jgi:HlyD family secretion protein|nr:HlyD family efflux transporter periplasmic adaptor subunit [Planctomycetota bacterium]MDP6761579.1 HlyD family efflux transporter periplasmic adaptor subunit [Planctomycetota bacterium]MDP6990967.1 HlyD family efflux transporter periplasmic adaptor subunit [Planctomycetota bacterium]